MWRLLWISLLGLSACGGASSDATKPAPSASTPTQTVGPVVFVGDSITAFWDGGGFTIPNPKLSELVPSEFNAGVSGNRTEEMLARYDAVLAKHPSLVVILGGTNDLRQIEVPTTDNINTMAERAAAAGARVVICLIPPASVTLYPTSVAPDDTVNDARIRHFNSQLRSLAAGFGYAVVDYYGAMVNADGSQRRELFVSTDLIHPNAEGYHVMWSVLQPVLTSFHGLIPFAATE